MKQTKPSPTGEGDNKVDSRDKKADKIRIFADFAESVLYRTSVRLRSAFCENKRNLSVSEITDQTLCGNLLAVGVKPTRG